MKRHLLFALVFGLALVLAAGVALPAFAARKNAPEIQEYLERAKKDRQEQDKKEAAARKADPYRRLRPYQTYEEINAELDQLIADHPNLFSGGTYGRSVEGRPLRWLRLSTGPGDKPEVLVTGNIHAQELAGGQMVMAIIERFAKGYGQDAEITRLAESVDVYFIPVLNPDRMVKAVAEQVRWGMTGFVRKNVNGVDLNRNFPYPQDAPAKLADGAGSPKKRSENFRGLSPLSESETRALINFVDRHQFVLALNYHTSGGLILYSNGTFPNPTPDTDLMREIALAYQAEQFDQYRVERSIELYPTIGALDDYLYHRYGILAFTVEVGKDTEDQVFVPYNGTLSPVFWAYNVHELQREKANNVPGALTMLRSAVKLHQHPELRQWKPEEPWTGEPAR
jgi:murein tripeptide amidase MpaA